MKNSMSFRGWYYFRMGWATYFAFIFAAINTLTVTYYLAIEKYPVLTGIFPTFLQYVIIIAGIGIPILIIVGYKTKIAAALLSLFCIATAFIFHNDFSNQMQLTSFLKNIALAGGFLFLFINGARGLSLDNKFNK